MAIYPMTSKKELHQFSEHILNSFLQPAMDKVRESEAFELEDVDTLWDKIKTSYLKISKEEYYNFKDDDVTYSDEIEFVDELAEIFAVGLEELKKNGEDIGDPEYLVMVKFVKNMRELIQAKY